MHNVKESVEVGVTSPTSTLFSTSSENFMQWLVGPILAHGFLIKTYDEGST